MKLRSLLVSALMLLNGVERVWSSCKSGDHYPVINDPYNLTDRLLLFTPPDPVSQTMFDKTTTITIVTHNTQSGYSLTCNPDLVANLYQQVTAITEAHYYASQEVDIGTIHCHCNQPQLYSNSTGKYAAYLRTLSYALGYYGHTSGSVYPFLETRYYLYKHYSTEVRGLIAQRTQPPQLKGRDMWIVSTHFQYDSLTVRTQTSIELVAYVKALAAEFPQAAFIVPGDYYVQYGDPDYATLTSYFYDSWYNMTSLHTNGSTWPSDDPILRFDYVFYRPPADGCPMKPVGYSVFEDETSDHAPVRVDFAFPTLNSGINSLPMNEAPFPYTTTDSGSSVYTSSSSSTTSSTSSTSSTTSSTSSTSSTTSSTSSTSSTTSSTSSTSSTTSSTSSTTSATSTTGSTTGGSSTSNCAATYKLVPRAGGNYQSDGKTYSIIDIHVINTGTCTITAANLKVPMASGIVQTWNYNKDTGAITIYGIVPNQQQSGAGFIYVSSDSYPSASPVFSSSCFTCVNPSEIKGVPVNPTQDTCGVNLEIDARVGDQATWSDGTTISQIYDLSVTNNGATPITNVTVVITSDGDITQTWNMDALTSEIYSVDLFGQQIDPGNTLYKTAGFVVAGENPLSPANSVFLVSATC